MIIITIQFMLLAMNYIHRHVEGTLAGNILLRRDFHAKKYFGENGPETM